MRPLVLASASPRRAELLRAAGIPFEAAAAHIDESVRPGETAEAYVRRVAREKARVVAARLPGRLVLAADTTVVVDERILAKPEDPADAVRMLRALSGRSHLVLTAVCLAGPAPDTARSDVSVTTVEFAPMTEAEIAEYVASGEPMDKAGAYGIQGLASRYVTRVEGSYTNVVGLPVALVYRMLAATPPSR